MKSLQEALQNQIKETSEKAEKHQATVSVFVSLLWVIALGLRSYFFLFSNHKRKIHYKKKIMKSPQQKLQSF